MEKIHKILSLLLLCTVALASCLSTNETETTPLCAIGTWTVGDIKSNVTVERDGKCDTIVTRTISGSSIYFNIDQINGTITTVDSIASWADLSNIKPSYTASGNVYARVAGEDTFYYLTSGSDSLSIEQPLELLVVATDGISTKKYTVTMKKSSTALDEFNWSKVNTNFAVRNDFNVIENDGNVYAFYTNDEGKTNFVYASTALKLEKWSDPSSVNVDIDYSSIVIFNKEFYALTTDGYIYKSEDNLLPVNWKKASDKQFSRLLSADKYYIYATDGYEIFGSDNLQNWFSNGKDDIDLLPNRCIDYYSYTSKTNPDIEIAMMCGINDKNNTHGTAWYKVSSDDKDINQNWMYIQVTKDNSYGLPSFSDMSTAYSKGSIYAIGIYSDTNNYKYLYRSEDNGITWKEQSDSFSLPKELDAKNGSARLICTDNLQLGEANKIWIIQKGGNIWGGTIR